MTDCTTHLATHTPGPFTFDGFGFGYGGLFPAGGFFDGFGVNLYNILVRYSGCQGRQLASTTPQPPSPLPLCKHRGKLVCLPASS